MKLVRLFYHRGDDVRVVRVWLEVETLDKAQEAGLSWAECFEPEHDDSWNFLNSVAVDPEGVGIVRDGDFVVVGPKQDGEEA